MKPEPPAVPASPHLDQLPLEYRREIESLRESVSRLEAEHSALLERLDLLHGELQRSRDTLKSALSQRDAEMVAVRKLAETNSRIVDQLLKAKVWKLLTLGSRIIRYGQYVLNRATSPIRRGGIFVSSEEAHLICEEPSESDAMARSGIIRVKGWAAAASGIANVRVQIANEAAVDAQLGIARPDVAAVHSLPGADRSGWSCQLDSANVPNGRQLIRVEASTTRGRKLQTVVPISINHETGFEDDYDRWRHEFEVEDRFEITKRLHALLIRPAVSIVMPVYKTPIPLLEHAIDSVLRQSYPDWELCIADDHSESAEITQLLEQYSKRDPRIKYCSRSVNGGISAASNSALELASGDFVTLLDHDDELAPNALFHLADALEARPDADLLYSDEDKIDESGHRYNPFFKPDWSPDLLLSMNYICHLVMFRRSLLEQIGGFRSAYDGSQDYDLVLRISSVARDIVHVPRVLYHWRSVAGSTAADGYAKSYAIDAAGKAIASHLDRARIEAEVLSTAEPGRWRIRYRMTESPRAGIIIASGGNAQILKANVESIFTKTSYKNFEVIIADNSDGTEIETLTNDLGRFGAVVYFDWRNRPFNYSIINNRAAEQTQSPVLLFLNDDTSVIAPDWLESMIGQAMRPQVGAVGAKLLYPDGRIQHAGVVMGLFENCGHGFKGMDGSRPHYFSFTDVTRNVSAVTGACLMCRAEVFREVGCFDETDFAVAFNDVDLCLKMRQVGYRVIYTPDAVLFHYEAFSKTAKDLNPHPHEVACMRRKWGSAIVTDPYYNPNLTRSDEEYSLRRS